MLAPAGLCLALLSVAHCARFVEVDSIEQIERHCRALQSGQVVFNGAGIKANYRPYVVTTYGVSNLTPVELYINSSGHCTVNIPGSGYQFFHVYQASPKIVYLSHFNSHRRVFSVDTSTCATHDLSDKFHESKSDTRLQAIYYEDGFDEIFKENNTMYLQSYDFAGNRIGRPRTFLQDSQMDLVLPISAKSRSSNLIVKSYEREENEGELNLVDADGRLIKHLLSFEYDPTLGVPVVYDVGDSSFTFCYHGYSNYECAQFDHSGNEVLRKSVSYSNQMSCVNLRHGLLSVHNLKDGPGFVLFTESCKYPSDPSPDDATRGGTVEPPVTVNIMVTEVRSGKTIEKLHRLSKKQDMSVSVTDYDEDSGKFTVRGGLYPVKEICLSTFSLATKRD